MASSKCDLPTGSDETNNGKDNTVSAIPKTKDLGQQFSTKTWREDMTLIVQGKQLYVASNILSLISPVFTAMFDELFGENAPREIELKDKNYDDVVEFLLCSYPNIRKNVDLDNVYAVLPLAREYDVKLLTERCETLLLSMVDNQTKTEDLCMYLNKACTFRLVDIKEKCLILLSEMDIEKIQKVEKKLPLSHEAEVEFLHRIILSKERKISQLKKNNEDFEKVLRNVNCIKYFFYLRSKNTYKLFKYLDSPAIFAHGIRWNIQVVISGEEDDKNLGIYLTNNAQTTVSPCRVRGVFLMHNFINEEDSICQSIDQAFTDEDDFYGWGCDDFVEIEIIEDELEGFLSNDRIHVEARFFVDDLPMEIIE